MPDAFLISTIASGKLVQRDPLHYYEMYTHLWEKVNNLISSLKENSHSKCLISLFNFWTMFFFYLLLFSYMHSGGFKELSSDPAKVIDEAVEDTSNWINGFISLLSDTLSTTDDDVDEGIGNLLCSRYTLCNIYIYDDYIICARCPNCLK